MPYLRQELNDSGFVFRSWVKIIALAVSLIDVISLAIVLLSHC